nr:DUF2249 domain-containing protein [Aureimonas sp. SA4125]
MPETAVLNSVIDVRTLPPLERHSTIFGRIDGLAPGASLVIVVDHAPRPLHHQLEARHPGQFWSCPSTWWKLSVAEAAPFQATSVEICSGFAVLPMAMRSAMGSVCM